MRKNIYFLSFAIFTLFFLACNEMEKVEVDPKIKMASDSQCLATMQKHLDAVSNRDLTALKSTLSPQGNMQLLLPQTELMNTVDEFMEYHTEWFKDSLWTFETKIVNSEIGESIAMAVTEVIYREPERNGKPYFNRMHVSYALKKIDGQWYVIKDQACSIEKTK